MNISQGQRYFSETEPELGLGVITEIHPKTIQILYPLSQELRNYAKKTAPLKRYLLEVGDSFFIKDQKYQVEEIKQKDELIYYCTQGLEYCETLLDAKIDINGPLERFFILNHDPLEHYNLRYQTALNYRKYSQFKYKGFLGAKIRLIPHQVFVANQVLSLPSPKALLCDEVGLGKTIEALLILHSLYQQELIKTCLIIVPDALKNQWFIELYKKFSLTSKILGSEFEEENINLNETNLLIMGKSEMEGNSSISQKQWDMLIVDEAHQYNFKQPSTRLDFIADINQNTFSTLFLSATPEITGEENLFYQLKMLDSNKFKQYEIFLEQKKKYQKISEILKNLENNNQSNLSQYLSEDEINHLSSEEIKQALVDRFGIGRNFFRNSRDHLQKFENLFTKRIPKPLPITIDTKSISDKKVVTAKAQELLPLLSSSEDKFFIICHAKNIVLQLQKHLLEHANFKIALFHSDQSLLERDRQAAYFADPDGAQLLLCTEIGSEGRNFEFAHSLVLFDLPKTPDQLEQRIGRLDRIGQTKDINIYIPYIENSFEETIFRWYAQVLESFQGFSNAAGPFFNKHKEELHKLLSSKFDADIINPFISNKRLEFQNYKKKLQNSKDLLHEIKSYRPQIAKKIIQDLHQFEEDQKLGAYLEQVFEQVGVDFSEIKTKTYFISPSNNMLIPSYAGLSSEGTSYTFDRDFSIKHENIDYLNWEHPLTKTAYDLFLNSTLGNLALAKSDNLPRNIYFEFIFGLQCQDKFKLLASQYLPYTPIRILLDVQQNNLTQKYPKKFIDQSIKPIEPRTLELFKSFPKDQITEIKNKAHQMALPRSAKYKKEASEMLNLELEKEMARIGDLEKDLNQKNEMLKHQQEKFHMLSESIQTSSIELIAFRVIITE